MSKQINTNAYLVYLLNQSKERNEQQNKPDDIIYGKSILDIQDRKKNDGNNHILNFIREKRN